MKPTRITLDVWPDGRVEIVSETATPNEVYLDRTDPEFERKKEDLKSKGYRWDRTKKCWRRSSKPVDSATASTNMSNWWKDAEEVRLSKDDPDFEAKKAALKTAGATWDGIDKVWVLPQA